MHHMHAFLCAICFVEPEYRMYHFKYVSISTILGERKGDLRGCTALIPSILLPSILKFECLGQ